MSYDKSVFTEEGLAAMGSDHKQTVERMFASPHSRIAKAKLAQEQSQTALFAPKPSIPSQKRPIYSANLNSRNAWEQ